MQQLDKNEYELRVGNFLKNVSETLNIELKGWIDLDKNIGKFQLIRGCIALYNSNGGMFAISIDDKTHNFTKHSHTNEHIKKYYHLDSIQKFITTYSTENFEVYVHFHNHDGQLYPFIFIPSGVKIPALIKKDLLNDDKTKSPLLVEGDLYIRTVKTSVISSSKLKHREDWEKLINTCHENREADIAKFAQKHFTAHQIEILRTYFTGLSTPDHQISESEISRCLRDGVRQFETVTKEETIPQHGSFQIGFKINGGANKPKIDKKLLDMLKIHNPGPLTSRKLLWGIYNGDRYKPKRIKNLWRAFINDSPNSLDFWIIADDYFFYHYRALQDDFNGSTTQQAKNAKLKELDFIWAIKDVSLALITAIRFAKTLKFEEDTTISFIFRWNGLKDRYLTSWAHPDYIINAPDLSDQNDFFKEVTLSLNASEANIASVCNEVVSDLFLNFGGYSMNKNSIVTIVYEFLNC